MSSEDAKLIEEIDKTRNSLSTDRMDMSFGEILSMYRNDELIIDPEFQRLFRWSLEQQTRFIESLLLGMPIPPVFVAEDEDGRWEVVDGLQRLSTVISFFGELKILPEKNNWALSKGGLVTLFEGHSCDSLPLRLKLNIKRVACRIEIVRWNSKYDMRYELFNRLNTGGAPLTDQEIRNCIFRGSSQEFNRFLSEEARSKAFVNLISPTVKQVEELYLDELILRFCSLYESKDNIKSNISQHMTSFMRNIVNSSEKIEYYRTILHRTISLLKQLGKDVFRRKNNVFSTGFYDGIMIGIAHNIEKYEQRDISYLNGKIAELKLDEKFLKVTGASANSKTRSSKRIERANALFSEE